MRSIVASHSFSFTAFGTFILAAEKTLIIAKLVLTFSINLIKTNGYIRLQIFVLTYKLPKYKLVCHFLKQSK